MMMRNSSLKKVVTVILALLCMNGAMAQNISFSRETFCFGNITLPYRKADISGVEDKASLVVYLHGGSSKGNDNEIQITEPAVNSISMWLAANRHKAVMLVPQCPKDKSWMGAMLGGRESISPPICR